MRDCPSLFYVFSLFSSYIPHFYDVTWLIFETLCRVTNNSTIADRNLMVIRKCGIVRLLAWYVLFFLHLQDISYFRTFKSLSKSKKILSSLLASCTSLGSGVRDVVQRTPTPFRCPIRG